MSQRAESGKVSRKRAPKRPVQPCEWCNKIFKSNYHKEKHDRNRAMLECPHCNEHFCHTRTIQTHIHIEHPEFARRFEEDQFSQSHLVSNESPASFPDPMLMLNQQLHPSVINAVFQSWPQIAESFLQPSLSIPENQYDSIIKDNEYKPNEKHNLMEDNEYLHPEISNPDGYLQHPQLSFPGSGNTLPIPDMPQMDSSALLSPQPSLINSDLHDDLGMIDLSPELSVLESHDDSISII
eukprot:TRINITY_DN777822_c0_g1_i1.p1 TRINITY_DN777822_c0_g1~~TRINITY_DN777822_c0_g1_i1.p1  ORF type:complete len:238 (-),score=35.36 TRINITY_DN777822_c0_g1_i1:165-878(-)